MNHKQILMFAKQVRQCGGASEQTKRSRSNGWKGRERTERLTIRQHHGMNTLGQFSPTEAFVVPQLAVLSPVEQSTIQQLKMIPFKF